MTVCRIGQVGLGTWGMMQCHALSKLSEIKFAGVFDIDEDLVRQASNRFAVPAFHELDTLFRNVDAVVIAVPTVKHFEIANEALLHNVNVFVEKPIAASVSEARKLVQLAEQKNLTLQVGHIERFNPAGLALNSETVRPNYIEASRLSLLDGRARDVSVVHDLMIHDLDLVLYFAQSEIAQIQAHGLSVVTQAIDVANARIEFKNGCLATLTASRIAAARHRQMNLYQEDAYFRLDFLRHETQKLNIAHVTELELQSKVVSGPKDVPHSPNSLFEVINTVKVDPLLLELQAFADGVKSRSKPLVDGLHGQRVLEVAAEILTKIEHSKKP